MYLPDDVDRRLRREYGPQEVIEIYAALEDLQRVNHATSPRVIRCIVHLAEGNAERLLDLIENARTDWRDVVLWAEYDQRGKNRLHDFTKAF